MRRQKKFYAWGYADEDLTAEEIKPWETDIAKRYGVSGFDVTPPPKADEIALRPPRVTVPAALQSIVRTDHAIVVHAQGSVMPAQQVVLQPEVGGRILWRSDNLVPGAIVRAGEPLVRIDASNYQLALRTQEAQVNRAELDLQLEASRKEVAQREWQLLAAQTGEGARAPNPLAIRDPQMKTAQVSVEAAKSALDSAKLNVSRTALVSPFNAFVQRAAADRGQLVSPGSQVARAAAYLMQGQVEAGTLCPTTMTFAAVPLLQREPAGVVDFAGQWLPALYAREFDGSDAPLAAKRRVHFHAFLQELQGRMRDFAGQADPLALAARALAEETRLLCFDEFHVHDIGDAVLLGRLLKVLVEEGVGLVCTSNYHPHGLCPNPLYRERFKPAISLIEKRFEVLNLDGGEDYRQRRGVLLETPGLTGVIAGARNARQAALVANLGVSVPADQAAAVWAIAGRLAKDLEML